jgi:TRAP transporter T-component
MKNMTRHPMAIRFRGFLPFLLLAALVGCSPMKYSVRHVMLPLLENSRQAAYLSNDTRTFGDAAPSNLFLLEGMIQTDPENEELRLNTAMLYFFYGFAYMEEDDPDYASLLYSKGLDHAWTALHSRCDLPEDRGIAFSKFEPLVPSIGLDQVPAAVWSAICWSQYISLHLDQTSVMRDIPKVQALLDRAIELDGNYFEGMPHVIQGSLHAFKPKIMGGDTDASAASFEKAFSISGNSFLLSRLFYARYYTYRMMDVDLFTETLDGIINAKPIEDDPYLLLNMIAVEKSHKLLEETDDLF